MESECRETAVSRNNYFYDIDMISGILPVTIFLWFTIWIKFWIGF